MSKNIINFYRLANKLKYVLRTGWSEVGITSSRAESVAEHIYGSLVLAMAIESETDLKLDMLKVYKMIIIKELEKIELKKEYTPGSDTTNRESKAIETVRKITEDLIAADEFLALLNEANERQTPEAAFAFMVSKIESDLQAKIYDLNGEFNLDKALEDAQNYGESLASKIIPQMVNASDGWILYDRRYYQGSKLFEDLSEEIQRLK